LKYNVIGTIPHEPEIQATVECLSYGLFGIDHSFDLIDIFPVI
jgi:hypothetical protein